MHVVCFPDNIQQQPAKQKAQHQSQFRLTDDPEAKLTESCHQGIESGDCGSQSSCLYFLVQFLSTITVAQLQGQ
jgi:hypothetical protein